MAMLLLATQDLLMIKGEFIALLSWEKTCNTPFKQWSVLHLELQAAVVSTCLHMLIHDELDLPVQRVTFWTDSLTVLQYITYEKRQFKPFTGNRVNEIHGASTPEQW